MNKKNNRKGFTTVELVIVIAVIAILATALIPTFGGLIDSANKTANEQEVRNIYRDYLAENPAENASASYYIEVDGKYYLVNGGELSTTPAEGIEDATDVPCTYKIVTADNYNSNTISNGTYHVDTTPADGKCDFGGEAYTAPAAN